MISRREYVKAMRKRYRAAGGRTERSGLLDELVNVAGYTRKHAISLMNQRARRKATSRGKRTGRPRAYRHCLATAQTAWW